MKLLWNHLKPHRRLLLTALILAALNQGFSLLDPQIFRLIIDRYASRVAELTDKFRKSGVSIFADLRGISVAKLSAFRRELSKIGAEFKVAKKTLLRRALEAAGPAFGGIEPKALDGEIGVIFGYEDQVAPAKAATKFAKENETFKVLKGVLEGRMLEAAEILALARLPSRGELLAALAAAAVDWVAATPILVLSGAV